MRMYKLSSKVKREVREFAQGSIYRLNAKSADCYAFSIIKIGKQLNFIGGWDWSNSLIDKYAEYIYILKTDIFIKR